MPRTDSSHRTGRISPAVGVSGLAAQSAWACGQWVPGCGPRSPEPPITHHHQPLPQVSAWVGPHSLKDTMVPNPQTSDGAPRPPPLPHSCGQFCINHG